MAIMRQEHKLKPNKSSTYPKQILFYDTETAPTSIDSDTKRHDLKLGVGCYYQEKGNKQAAHEDYFDFTTVKAFWDTALNLVTTNRRLIIIAHNLDFDFLVCHGLSELKERGWFAQNMIISGNVDIWSFVQYKHPPDSPAWKSYVADKKKKPRVVKTIIFLDFMNYFKMALAKLGENIGVPKLKIDFETCTDEELRVYCRVDVKIMVEVWKRWTAFLQTHELGVWGKTLPSQAFNAFRHRFMKHDIFIHSNEPALQLERRAYHGGRTECFQIGEFKQGPYYLLDVNSMYPSVMRYRDYPTALLSYQEKGCWEDLLYHIKDKAIVADVLVESNRSAFPFRYKGKLIFPVGRFRTTLTTPELLQAIDHREIKELGTMAVYEQAPIFARYIDFFYKKRVGFKMAKDTAYVFITKLLMNSLYGKFGQQLDQFVPIAEDREHKLNFWSEWDADDQKWLSFKQINGKVEVFDGKAEAYNSFPAIAAHVTAHSRLLLHLLLSSVPRYSLFYADTDSLIVDQRGYDAVKHLCSNTRLGALHLEKQSSAIQINNVKDYVFARHRKIKGVRKNAEKLGRDVFAQWQQVSLKAVIRQDKPDACFWHRVKKHLKGVYNKGMVYPDGMVLPFRLWEG